MLKNNSPCLCGHSKANHLAPHFWLDDKREVIDTRFGCSVKFCDCKLFELDNLKYLEKEYESRE